MTIKKKLQEKFLKILQKLFPKLKEICFAREKFILLPGVYEPREDTYLLALQLKKMHLDRKNILELGCGSGVISILCAKKGANVTSIDIDINAVLATFINACIHNVRINVLIGDLFTPVLGKKFDLIFANLPYLPGNRKQDPAIFSGPKGNELILRSLYFLRFHLKENGCAIYIFSSESNPKEILNFAKKQGLMYFLLDYFEFPHETIYCYEFQIFREL